MRCLMCKQVLIQSTIPHVRGVDGPYSVTFLNLPCLACPAAHEWYFPIRHFEYLLVMCLGKNNLVALNNGVNEDLLECPQCQRFMEGPGVGYRELRSVVILKDLEAFEVELWSPAFECSDCDIFFIMPRHEQSHSSLGAAIRKAFDRFDLGPPSPTWRLYKRIVRWLH